MLWCFFWRSPCSGGSHEQIPHPDASEILFKSPCNIDRFSLGGYVLNGSVGNNIPYHGGIRWKTLINNSPPERLSLMCWQLPSRKLRLQRVWWAVTPLRAMVDTQMREFLLLPFSWDAALCLTHGHFWSNVIGPITKQFRSQRRHLARIEDFKKFHDENTLVKGPTFSARLLWAIVRNISKTFACLGA